MKLILDKMEAHFFLYNMQMSPGDMARTLTIVYVFPKAFIQERVLYMHITVWLLIFEGDLFSLFSRVHS